MIPLRNQKGETVAHALVDESDFEQLNRHRWFLGRSGYAARSDYSTGRCRQVLMHRVILDLHHGDPRQGDHINRDRVDNRRLNLRVLTSAEQAQNRGARRGSASAFRGVMRGWRDGLWIAQVTLDGVRHHLGTFPNETDAARAAAAARAELLPYSQEAY